jgi:hypothetical protein
MTTRISLLLTGACVFATACSDDGRADTEANTDVGSGSVSVSGGVTEADTDPTPTSTPTSTPGDPSGDTPGSASNVTDATDGTTTVDPSGTTVMTSADTDTGDDPIVEVVIDPLDAIVTVVDGQIPAPLQYTAKGITMMGVEVPLNGSWDYDRLDLASLGVQSGTFSATGFAGGKGTVTFDPAGDLGAVQTSATVKLQFTSEPDPVDPGIKDMFGAAIDPDPAMVLLYPYDKTVFPRGLTGPTVQWNGGGANDLYYIHVYSDFFEFKGYSKVPPPSRYNFPKMPADVWLKLTASTEGPVVFDIQRHDGNKAYLAKTQTWTIAPANLTGAVYYWEVNNGNVVRLNIGDAAPAVHQQAAGRLLRRLSQRLQGRLAHRRRLPRRLQPVERHRGRHRQRPLLPRQGLRLPGHLAQRLARAVGPVRRDRPAQADHLRQRGRARHPDHPRRQAGPPGLGPATAAAIAFARKTDGNWLDFNNSELWTADVDLMTNTFANVKQIVDKTAAARHHDDLPDLRAGLGVDRVQPPQPGPHPRRRHRGLALQLRRLAPRCASTRPTASASSSPARTRPPTSRPSCPSPSAATTGSSSAPSASTATRSPT